MATTDESTERRGIRFAARPTSASQCRSEAELRGALTSTPSDPLLLYQLGVLLQDSGQPAEALTYLQQALERDPRNEEIQRGRES
jgi:tetratricopeptide (TPR) repeat protein